MAGPTQASWSSRLVFLLAAVGASVGLGNVWKFPYLAGVNGGGAFVIVYVGAAALVAVPILIAELMIGRRGRHHPAAAMAGVASESGRSRRWGLVGGLGVVVAYLILTYYSVIAGWAMAYVGPTLAGRLDAIDGPAATAHFAGLLADPWGLAVWHGLFMALTTGIVAQGLRAGIERWITILMPALFAALLLLLGYALVEGDFAAAVRFLFAPDFSKLSGPMVLAAVGQAFFSIGVGMGMMMAYGAYLAPGVSLTRSAFVIAGADTLVAVLAGLAIFPLVFANGLDPGEGPGLVFVTLPIAFGSMPGGQFFGGLFFVLLVCAALTSSIAVLEPVVMWATERFDSSRRASALASGAIAWCIGLGTVLSFNAWSGWHPFGRIQRFATMTFFDLLDYATSNVMMPLAALLIALFTGWRMGREVACDELGMGAGLRFRAWRNVLLRWIAPVAILGILATGL